MHSAAPITVRPAEPADAADMAGLARAAYQHYVSRIGREPVPMTADYVSLAESGHTWVAEQHGRLVGLVVLEPRQDHLLIENVAVEPQAQGQGVGSRLLALAEERAVSSGLPEVRLYTHEAMTENLAFYPRRGYDETHRSTESGYRRVFFSKRLATRRRERPSAQRGPV